MPEVKPDQSSAASKKEQVEQMFNSIAHRYDFLNHFLSIGIDKIWRKRAVNSLKPFQPKQILDVATGTGDLAIEALRLNPEKITGVDIANQMLEIGRKKIEMMGYASKIELILADSENLIFPNNSFDAVTVAFGVRNFENLEKGLKEMNRVLKNGGHLVVLEFSKPRVFPYKQLYHFYFRNILPLWGNLLSKSKEAYTYLPESVHHFPEREEFMKILSNCGFKNIIAKPLTFGTCCLYLSEK